MDTTYLEERRKGIGGSDVAAILGLSPWKTPYRVYQEKRKEIDDWKGNAQTDWGTRMEPVLRQWYSDTTGRVVRVPDKIIKSNKYPFMLASLDGFTDDKRVVEIKTARHGKDWGEPGTNEIPDYYAVQCHHYMIVTGYEVTDMPVSIAGGSPALYEVPADKEIAEMIIEACASFWQRVQAGDPPDPVTYADAVQRYGGIRAEGIVTADEELLSIIEKLKETRATIKDLEVTEEYLKGKVIMALGERGDTLVASDGKPLATYRLTKGRAVLDTKTLQTEMPDVWAKYQKTLAPQRRFLVK